MAMAFLSSSSICLVLLIFMVLSTSTASAINSISAVLPLRAAAYGTSFDATLEIGGNSYPVLADTGSSDLWLLDPGWKCYYGSANTNGTEVPQSKCLFGTDTYKKSSTYEPITTAWLGEHYGAGNAIGTLGYESVKVGNITIAHQEMGFVNKSSGTSDSYNVGIMGLGHPVIASIHPENYSAVTDLQLLGDRLLYPTLLTSMVKEGMEPYFAVALERTPMDQEYGPGGYVSFGTLPPVAYGEWVTTPVEVTKTIPASFTNGTGKISEWTLTVEAVTWGNETNSTAFQAVVDTGNWQNVFPEALATEINSKFDPPAGKFNEAGAYPVNCDAIPPSNSGVQINGKMFSVNSEDMIWRDPSGKCYSSVGTLLPSYGVSLYFLGDAFLKNVVAVFDFGKEEFRFAPRLESNSTSPVPPSTSGTARVGISYLSIVVALLFALST